MRAVDCAGLLGKMVKTDEAEGIVYEVEDTSVTFGRVRTVRLRMYHHDYRTEGSIIIDESVHLTVSEAPPMRWITPPPVPTVSTRQALINLGISPTDVGRLLHESAWPRTWVAGDTNQFDKVARYEAGADPIPVPQGAHAGPGQLWYRLLNMTKEERLDLLEQLIDDSGTAYKCWLDSHESQIEMFRSQRDDALRRLGEIP